MQKEAEDMAKHGLHILCRHCMHTCHGTLPTSNVAACICQAALCALMVLCRGMLAMPAEGC